MVFLGGVVVVGVEVEVFVVVRIAGAARGGKGWRRCRGGDMAGCGEVAGHYCAG